MAKERLSDKEKKRRRSVYFREYYAKNKKHIRENQKEYYAENREERREYQNSHHVEREPTQGDRERVRRARALSFGVKICEMPDDYEGILTERQNGLCYFCGEPLVNDVMYLDHLTPHSRGGPHSMDNVVLACQTCNLEKAWLTEEEFAIARKWDRMDGFGFCRKCMRGLPLEEFYVNKHQKIGRSSKCKDCYKEYNAKNNEKKARIA